MPVVKSSINGDDVTVIIFARSEIDALVSLLTRAKFPDTSEVKDAIEALDEFYFSLGIDYPPELG